MVGRVTQTTDWLPTRMSEPASLAQPSRTVGRVRIGWKLYEYYIQLLDCPQKQSDKRKNLVVVS